MIEQFPILLLGSGGREHALAIRLAASRRCQRLFVAPGNPGIATVAECVPLNILDTAAVVDFARRHAIGLVVIGPEAPLAAGLADALRAAGMAVFGPSAQAARLEASKGFTKELCDEAGVPTAAWRRFDALKPARDYVATHPLPVVVKADGLAAGKGVTVAETHAQAEAALDALFADEGAEVVIEACLTGEEVSFFVLSDGVTALPLLAAQDHKRAGDGDTGPNTGGMGAYAPAGVFTAALQAQTMDTIVEPTLATMRARGTPFSGVLFVGLMLTAEGPQLIEYNVRFGDPECQVLMALLESDLGDLLLAAATGTLAGHQLRWKPGAAATVVVAARGYPGKAAKGGRIEGIAEAERQGAAVLQAGTGLDGEGHLVATGGRVLSVTAAAGNVGAAVALCYRAVGRIDYADGFWRQDIGWREIVRESGNNSA